MKRPATTLKHDGCGGTLLGRRGVRYRTCDRCSAVVDLGMSSRSVTPDSERRATLGEARAAQEIGCGQRRRIK